MSEASFTELPYVVPLINLVPEQYDKTTQLIPTYCLVDVNNKFNPGIVYLNGMTYLLTEDIANMDYDLIEEANRKLNEGGSNCLHFASAAKYDKVLITINRVL